MRTHLYTTPINRTDPVQRIRDRISMTLAYWCNQNTLSLSENFVFEQHKNRRFDWCIGALKIAVLFEKPNDVASAAMSRGWKVICLSASNHNSLLSQLNQTLKEVFGG